MSNNTIKTDVLIIGAGFAGIFAALSLVEQGYKKKIIIIEKGNNYFKRYCPVDHEKICNGCGGVCHVVSGFGGSLHYGDNVKLSYFPSGRALYKKIKDNYFKYLNKILDILEISKSDFSSYDVSNDKYFSSQIKGYPVLTLNSLKLKKILENIYEELNKHSNIDIIFNSECNEIQNNKDEFLIHTTKNKFICNNLVIATGRAGLFWWNDYMDRLKIKYEPPTISLGVRFECPTSILHPIHQVHNDFKTTFYIDKHKFKTFCFSSGQGGGKIKFVNYSNNYTFLDGHTTDEDESDISNFAILTQLKHNDNTPLSFNEVEKEYLTKYKNLRTDKSGKPVIQSYIDFKNRTLKNKTLKDFQNNNIMYSKLDLEVKRLDKVLDDKIHSSLCQAFEKVFLDFCQYSNFDFVSSIKQISVIGLELEFMWNLPHLNSSMETNIENLYMVGDASGVAQGALQAAISSYAITNNIIK